MYSWLRFKYILVRFLPIGIYKNDFSERNGSCDLTIEKKTVLAVWWMHCFLFVLPFILDDLDTDSNLSAAARLEPPRRLGKSIESSHSQATRSTAKYSVYRRKPVLKQAAVFCESWPVQPVQSATCKPPSYPSAQAGGADATASPSHPKTPWHSPTRQHNRRWSPNWILNPLPN